MQWSLFHGSLNVHTFFDSPSIFGQTTEVSVYAKFHCDRSPNNEDTDLNMSKKLRMIRVEDVRTKTVIFVYLLYIGV